MAFPTRRRLALSLAALVYFGGIQLQKRIAWIDRLNIPAAVIGGLLFTLLVMLLRERGINVQLDTALQSTLSVAFFTSIGMGAGVATGELKTARLVGCPSSCVWAGAGCAEASA